MNSIVFMFSGQGAQYYRMGHGLYKKNAEFRYWMELLDDVARKFSGSSILARLYDPGMKKSEPLEDLAISHPALFMQQFSLARVLLKEGIFPNFFLGASLGEFVAVALSGAMPWEAVFEGVLTHASSVPKNCPPGGMLAVLHSPSIYEQLSVFHENSELSGINFDNHFVVSGTRENLERIIGFLKKEDIGYMRLPVKFAFHSSLVTAMRADCLNMVKKNAPERPKIPIVSCALAGRVDTIAQDYFWRVVREPIRFRETLGILEKSQPHVYLDLGPSGTLASFVSYNLDDRSGSRHHPVMSPFTESVRPLETVIDLYGKKPSTSAGKGERKMRAFMFPGQGSQKKGMGADLFDQFGDYIDVAEKILGYDIRKLCERDPEGMLSSTQYTQPALFLVNALSWLARADSDSVDSSYFLGHSLGEYSALWAAGAFDFETGLRLVAERGKLMSQAEGGAMAAVIGAEPDRIERLLTENRLDRVVIANRNSPQQFVISGPAADIERAEPIFKKDGIRLFIKLPVSGAFHSPLMKSAAERFRAFVEPFRFQPPDFPVISNVTAREHDPQLIKHRLVEQMVAPVQWIESVRYLMGKGVNEFTEIGPGAVLSGLVKKITPLGPLPDPEPDPEPEPEPQSLPEPDSQSDSQSESNSPPAPTSRSKPEPSAPPTHFPKTRITPQSLGAEEFQKLYGLEISCICGGMEREISRPEQVIALGSSGMMGFFATEGLGASELESAIGRIASALKEAPRGFSLTASHDGFDDDDVVVGILLRHRERVLEVSGYFRITPALARYRLSGLERRTDGAVVAKNKIFARVSRPETAEVFLRPAPESVVNQLVEKGAVLPEQAHLAGKVPMADALIVDPRSENGDADLDLSHVLAPAIRRMEKKIGQQRGTSHRVLVGAGGGIGTPESAAAAFLLGADFIDIGEIVPCSVESGASETVKDMLSRMDIQDTGTAPAERMFELGARERVLKKGVFYPARASKLYDLYRLYESLDRIDQGTLARLEKSFFKKELARVWEDVKSFWQIHDPSRVEKAEGNARYKMGLVFRWYLRRAARLAMEGREEEKINFRVPASPALGAFNRWVAGSEWEPWQNRRAARIGIMLIEETANFLERRIRHLAAR